MQSWPRPAVPSLPGRGSAPVVHDTASGGRLELAPDDGVATLYVCGITPYDATHLGHATTYLAFDTLQRVWLDAGFRTRYAQNITDVDDPLLERAAATGVDWRDLAADQVQLFRSDMTALGVLPPDAYIGVTEVVPEIAGAVAVLESKGIAYRVPAPDARDDGAEDLYFDSAAAGSDAWALGDESNYDAETMARFFAERGGDPDRSGKRDPLDPLLWRAVREGEPSWPSVVGEGRPGWHIECSVIALDELGTDFTVQGGGSDLIFPHHEFSAGHAAALSGEPLAQAYLHVGMVAYEGEKMSKSLGNLVLVSKLVAQGEDPRAVRLTILAEHYRSDWEYAASALERARTRLTAWTDAFGPEAIATAGIRADGILAQLRGVLADDLDTPGALSILDEAASTGVDEPALLAAAADALLGIRLR